MSKIFGKVHSAIRDVEQNPATLTSGLVFSYLQTLNKIDLYYNSKFLKGDRDSEGFKKLFINIIKHRCSAATKAIDIDTKDIRVIAEDGQSYYKAWFIEKELRQFMKDHGFARLFNRIAELAPRYGSVVVKNVDGVPVIVNLRNIIWDQSISDIKKSPFVVERHIYTIDEFKQIASDKQWENYENVVNIYEKAGKGEVQVVEYYGYLCKDELEDPEERGEEYVFTRTIIAGLEFYGDKDKKKDLTCTPTVLAQDEIKELPYKKWDWEEEDGRSLGVGIVEDLFVNQEYHNDLAHIERKSLHWSSKKLFQTRDAEAPANLFGEVSNGDVLTLKSEITPVPMEERNLPQYNTVFQRIDENANQRSFTYEVNTGESLPSGTPFRLGAILSQAVNSHFAYKRENFAIFIKEIINDFVIPSFKKKSRKAHTLNFDGSREQLETIADFMVDTLMWKAVKDYNKKTGEYPSLEQYDRERAKIEKQVKGKESLHIEIPDDYYDDAKTRIEIDITGESVNTADIESLTTVFQIVSQNPAALQDPTTKRILDMILNKSGNNPIKVLGGSQQSQQSQPSPMNPSQMSQMPMPDMAGVMAGGQDGASPTPDNAQTL